MWDAKTGCALKSLRGHTNSVTCVGLISLSDSHKLADSLRGNGNECSTDNSQLALSASFDCCLKLWNIENGNNIRSIYTFNSITALCYLPNQLDQCIIGTEGGKLEVYSFIEEHSSPLVSIKPFDGPVSSIKV